MVSTSVIIAACVTLCVSLFLPVILYLIYGLKNKGKGVWTAWLLGAAGFFVFQILIRLPLLNLLSANQTFLTFAAKHYILYCLLLAFTAGLFEAAGRYAAAWTMRKSLSFERGFAAGLGHGGIEAMLLVGMTYVNNLVLILTINTGNFDALVEQSAALGTDTVSLLAARNALISAGPATFYLAGYERILTMTFHVFLSLLICHAVRCRRTLPGILFCLLLHTAADFAVPLINGMATPYLGSILSASTATILSYLFLTAVAAASAMGILYIRKRWKSEG